MPVIWLKDKTPELLQRSIAAASPREVAQLLDAIFRNHFGIRPFSGEDDDYAVGAEWQGITWIV